MEETTPSIIPVGTYQTSIEGTVTNIPPSVPTIGKRPISIPTANAVQIFEINEATNILSPTVLLKILAIEMPLQ